MLGNDGTTWETQSSAFTETLKSEIGLNTSKITTLENKTQNITATATETNMSKPIYLTTNGECLKMIGNHGFISSYDSALNTRDWYIGTPNSGNKNLNIINEKAGSITINSGSDGVTSNSGNNKINTISTGLVLSRNGSSYYSGGEIGLINSTNNVFHIVSNGANDIYMSSGSGIMTLYTSSSISLNSNVIWVGSGTAAGNGRFSNINMLDAGGQNWETQSSAFTETIKQQIITTTSKFTDASSFGGNLGKKKVIVNNFSIFGLGNITTLVNGTVYNNNTQYFNIGLLFYNNGLSEYFNSNGTYIYPTNVNFSFSFEMEFLTKSSNVVYVQSRFNLRNSTTGLEEDGTLYQGIYLNSASTTNEYIRYRVGPLKYIMTQNRSIYLQNMYNFSCGSIGNQTAISGHFTIERNPL
jgi:hypothetical protein